MSKLQNPIFSGRSERLRRMALIGVGLLTAVSICLFVFSGGTDRAHYRKATKNPPSPAQQDHALETTITTDRGDAGTPVPVASGNAGKSASAVEIERLTARQREIQKDYNTQYQAFINEHPELQEYYKIATEWANHWQRPGVSEQADLEHWLFENGQKAISQRRAQLGVLRQQMFAEELLPLLDDPQTADLVKQWLQAKKSDLARKTQTPPERLQGASAMYDLDESVLPPIAVLDAILTASDRTQVVDQYIQSLRKSGQVDVPPRVRAYIRDGVRAGTMVHSVSIPIQASLPPRLRQLKAEQDKLNEQIRKLSQTASVPPVTKR